MRDSEKNTVDHRGSIVMPQKQKITVEEKVKIVRDYLEKRISTSEAARKGGVDFNTVKTWISIYENEGVSGFTYGKDKVYSAELKETAVIEYLRGGSSQQEIAKKYGIRGTCSLRRWLKVYNAHGGLNSVKRSGGSYMKQGRETTQEERLEIVKDCLASSRYGPGRCGLRNLVRLVWKTAGASARRIRPRGQNWKRRR